MIRPEQIDVRLADVVGIDVVKDEVVRSLQLFLSHRSFAREMGGRPRRGLLFEGGPGTGKTYTAKALAAEAGVPFLFATATSFQSSFQGATARKIRQYFKALRKAARKHGGAVGFIEEFDAIGMARNGASAMTAAPAHRRHADVLRRPRGPADAPATPAAHDRDAVRHRRRRPADGGQRAAGADAVVRRADRRPRSCSASWSTPLNLLLPAHRQLRGPRGKHANILLIASTNRADTLDPALLRPGRFDRRLTFELPAKSGRRQLIDHFLGAQGARRGARLRRAPRRAGRRHPGLQPGDARGPARRGAHPGRPRASGPGCPGPTSSTPGCRSRSASASRWPTPTTSGG